jgi:hypothetical protein
MNGRVYDYNLGRFLSVDPFIQSPTNSQSLNPYSYIMNNPLSGTDPTGYMACTGSHIDKGGDCGDYGVSTTVYADNNKTRKQKQADISQGLTIASINASNNGFKSAQGAKNNSSNKTVDLGAKNTSNDVSVDGNTVNHTTERALESYSPEELKGTNFNVLWGQDYSGEDGTGRMFADYEYLNSIYDKVVADRSLGEKLFYGAFGDPNAPQLPMFEAGFGKGVRLVGSAAARWLGKGPKNTSVYLGFKGGKDVYVGITRQAINIRQAQHGAARFQLRQVTSYSLTRNQARAVEQALILRNPQYRNIINSISSKRPIYKGAVKWGDDFLDSMGL